jgi:transposase
MGVSKFTAEFKDEAIKQVSEKGRPVSEVAKRLGITPWTLYTWMKAAGVPTPAQQLTKPAPPDLAKENAALKAQIKRLEEERDILKKAAAYFARESR